MSKSETISNFQSTLQELDTFARKTGSKDKQKRKSRGIGNTVAKGAAVTAGTATLGTGGLAAAGLSGKGSAPLRKRAGQQLSALGSTLKTGSVKDLPANAKGIGGVGKSAVKVGASKLKFLAKKLITRGRG